MARSHLIETVFIWRLCITCSCACSLIFSCCWTVRLFSAALRRRRGGPSRAETQPLSGGGVEPIQPFKVDKEDNYDGVIVNMKDPMDPDSFVARLRASISEWGQRGKKGVWVKLPIELSNLVDPAVKEGFWYHHAEPDYVMLVYWIPDTPSTIPANASHLVGIGAFVMDSERRVLVVQEKGGMFKGTGLWKIPTGTVNEGEDISKAAIREVEEETGIKTEFMEILAFRQSHNGFYTKTDLFFVCMLHPKSFHIKIENVEIEAAQWMPIDDYSEQSFFKKNQQYDLTAKICIERLNQRISGFAPKTVTKTVNTDKGEEEEEVYVFCPKEMQY